MTVVNDGIVSIDAGNSTSTLGGAALAITAAGGDIDYSGSGVVVNNAGGDALAATQNGAGNVTLDVGGNIAAANGNGITVNNALNSGDIDVTVGGSINASGAGVTGILVNAQSVSGNVGITANAPITSSGRGIAATSNGGSITVVTDAVTAGTGAAIDLTQSNVIGGGSLLLTTNGDVSGANGINATNSGTGDIAMALNGKVTGTTGLGMSLFGNGAITVDVADTVTGALGGLDLQNSASSTGNIDISGTGGFVGLNGTGATLRTFGTGSVRLSVSGASSGNGAHGIQVFDQQAADFVSVRTGAVTATGATSDGITVGTLSITADVNITTNGAISAGRTGIAANILNGNATGDLTLFANAGVSGVNGIITNNQGSGRTRIVAAAPVVATTGAGVWATNRSGDISVDTNGVTAANTTAIWVRRTDASVAGDMFVFSRGAVLGRSGILAENAKGNAYVFASSSTDATAGNGITVNSSNLALVDVQGNVTARDYGIYTQSGSSDITVNGGTVQGQNGVFEQGFGTLSDARLTVGTSGRVIGTTEYGAYIQPSNAITVANRGLIQGVLGALRVNSASTQTAVTQITGSGNFVATNGHGIRIDQAGTQGTFVDLTGSITSTNGSGLLVNQTSNSGDINLRTGSVSATGANTYGISADTASTGSNISILARGPVSGTIAGINARLSSAAATGNIGIAAVAGVTSGFGGIYANNNGSGFVSVNAGGLVTGTDRGVEATSNGGAVTVLTGAVTATNTAVVGANLNAASSAVVNVTTNGLIQGALGISAGTRGTGDVTVATHDLVTGSTDFGARVFGGGNVYLNMDKTISGTTGAHVQGGSLVAGNVEVIGPGGFTGTNGHGLRVDNASNGYIAAFVDGATSAVNGAGIFLNNATNSGGMVIRSGDIAVSGLGATAIDARSRSLAGNFQLLSFGNVTSTGAGYFVGLQTAGATGNIRIDNFATVNATQVALSASHAGSGNVEIYNFGSLISTANQALSSSINGGNFTLENRGTITNAISVSGSNVANSAFRNFANGTWNTGNSNSSFSGALTNAGIINVNNGTTTIQGATTNSNRINFVGSGQFRALSGFTNSGVVNAQNNATGNVFAVTGNYNGGGQFLADYNTGTAAADVMTITGNATGTTTVGLNRTGLGVLAGGFLPIITVNGAAANNAFVSSNSFATTGFLLESFGRNPANAQQFGILQQVNADATDLGGMQTLAATVAPLLDEPISTIVNVKKDPARNEKQFGLWLRGSTADSDQDIATQISGSGIALASNRSYKINQKAIQGGADFGLLNMGDKGWNLHFGLTGGAGDAKARATVGAISYDYSTNFVGGYVFLTKNGFTFDASLRREWRDYSLVSAGLFGNGTPHDADGSATAGSVSASWKLGKDKGFSVTPHVGYSFASAEMDDLAIDSMSTLVAHKDKSSVGSVGAKIAYAIDLGGWSLTPFADVSGLKNWSNGESGNVVFTGGGSTNFAVESATFRDALRYSAGLNLRDASGQFSAFATATRTDGSRVGSTAFSLGARVNF